MNEEKFGKAVRTLYIVTYSILIVLSLFWSGIGALICVALKEEGLLGIFFIVLGLIMLGLSIGYLVYFIRLPEYSITYKDGKLYFRNKLECTPDRLENIESRTWGLDGAIFDYGRVIVTVAGEKYKFNFISKPQEAVNRLYAIRNEYIAAQNAAYYAAQAQAQAQAQAAAAQPQPEVTPAAAETLAPVAEPVAEVAPATEVPVTENAVTETPATENTETVEEVVEERNTTTGTEEDNG